MLRGPVVAALLLLGCGGGGTSLRAEQTARRHVMIVLPAADNDRVQRQRASDGSLLDATFERLDLAECARLCAAAGSPGEEVTGCFQTKVGDELKARLRSESSWVLDCAFR